MTDPRSRASGVPSEPPDEALPPVTPDDVRAAAQRVAGLARRTPLVTSPRLDALTGATVVCKAESLQRTGSFKVRGAANRILALDPGERGRGLLAASSGNHAQAVAAVAAAVGARATILMPHDAPANKRAATEAHGAQVLGYDRYAQDREELATRIARERGLVQVPAYDDPWVMAGQGTAALELLEEVGAVDVLVVPVGGGGLAAGCGTIARALCPDVELVGVEPAAGDDTRRSLLAGRRIRIPVPRTIADGQQADTPGRLTFEVNRRQLDRVEVVTDEQVVGAMAFANEHLGLVLEPSGATALAAVLTGGQTFAGRRVGVVLSGGNVSVERFGELLRTLSS
jgi:threo-3-hydroxy-L-aspartate ammonia-lyase